MTIMNEKTSPYNAAFDSENILAYFRQMGEIAASRGKQFEIAVFGGSALAISFDWRDSTHDVDYMIVRGAEKEITEIANEAAQSLGLPLDMLRSDVSIFASDHPELLPQGDYPPHGDGGLRVFVASPEYLLSMKILSMRSSLETQDCWDVWNLLDHLEVDQADSSLIMNKIEEIVRDFYPDQEIPLRNKCILEDILQEKLSGKDYRRDIGW